VQQIEALTEQLDEFKHYKELFGDPNAVVLTTVQPLVNDLRKTELGQMLTALECGAEATGSMCRVVWSGNFHAGSVDSLCHCF
jgi:hypothetical protein